MDNLNYDSVKPLEGEDVEFEDSDGNVRVLKIAEVNKAKFEDPMHENYTIIFQGDETFQCTQGCYNVKHPALGVNNLFITPNSEKECEAVISRPAASKDSTGT